MSRWAVVKNLWKLSTMKSENYNTHSEFLVEPGTIHAPIMWTVSRRVHFLLPGRDK